MNKNILTMIIVSLIAPTGYSAGTSSTSTTSSSTTSSGTTPSTSDTPTTSSGLPKSGSTTGSTTQDTMQNQGTTQSGTVGTTTEQAPDRRLRSSADRNEANVDQMSTTEDTSTSSRTTTSTAKGIKEPMSAKDTAITRSIREQIAADKSLSMRAKNVTIATQNGRITLKGAVANNSEKSKIEEIAKKVSGVQSVDNQTEVQSY